MVQILHPCSSSTNSRDTSHIVPNSLRSSSVMDNEGLPSQSDCPCQSTFHRHEQYETALNPTNYTMTGNKGRNWCFLQRKKRITGKKEEKKMWLRTAWIFEGLTKPSSKMPSRISWPAARGGGCLVLGTGGRGVRRVFVFCFFHWNFNAPFVERVL